jgi:peptidoglycan-associated lipoprotein
VQQPAAAPAPVVQQPVAGSPLDDPRSILYKRSVYFDFNKYDVKSDYQPLVQAHAQYVVAHPGARVVVQGNCDEVGSTEYNLALGQRRADAVMKSMKLLGVKDAQIESVSFGKEKPKATGNDEAAHAENRRDDIVYNTKQ